MDIVQVGAENYVCRAIRPDPIKRGEVISIADKAIAASLLNVTYRDMANNAHPYFVTPDDARAQRYLKKKAEAPSVQAEPRRRRSRKDAIAADTEAT